jgi:hypothetical protein
MIWFHRVTGGCILQDVRSALQEKRKVTAVLSFDPQIDLIVEVTRWYVRPPVRKVVVVTTIAGAKIVPEIARSAHVTLRRSSLGPKLNPTGTSILAVYWAYLATWNGTNQP